MPLFESERAYAAHIRNQIGAKAMYQIEISDAWRNYTSYVPNGVTALGVIRDSRTGNAGALFHLRKTDTFSQVNASCWQSLNQAAVRSALEAAQEAGPTHRGVPHIPTDAEIDAAMNER